MDGFAISPAELEAHEKQVRELMANISGATSSAFNPHDINAFGLIGQLWSWALTEWTEESDRAIKQAVAAGNHIADQLKEMRETHVARDTAAANQFNGIYGGSE